MIYLTVDVAPWEAALGQGIEVKHLRDLYTSIYLKCKKGQLRLKDKGIPNKTPGHLYLILNIVFPPAHSEKEAYQQLAEAFASFEPRSSHWEQDHDNHPLSRNCM